MKIINIVIAPHADDETLGCGGTIKKLKENGERFYWFLVTEPTESMGLTEEYMALRETVITNVSKAYDFDRVIRLGFPATELENKLVSKIIDGIKSNLPSTERLRIFAPFPGDAHSDHFFCFNAALALSKWFRTENFEALYCYETLSETEFGVNPVNLNFNPNIFSDITQYMDFKISTMEKYKTEIGDFPFPRSQISIESLARFRGSASGFDYAEAFMLIKGLLK